MIKQEDYGAQEAKLGKPQGKEPLEQGLQDFSQLACVGSKKKGREGGNFLFP